MAPGLPLVQAALIEPLAVAVHALRASKFKVSDTTAVLGAGPIGIMTAQVARLAGAQRVFVSERSPRRLQIAREMGFDVVDAGEQSIVDVVAEATRGVGLPIVFETAGVQPTIAEAIKMMIPANPGYSSLNLAAAVQVMCDELRLAAIAPGSPPAPENPPAGFEEIRRFYEHLEAAVTQSGFLDPAHPKRLMPRLRRLFDRIRLERDEVSLLRGMLKTFLKKPGDKVD